ncbi:acyl-CoA dehydrogenase family protein [Streptomyces cavernicola]|uniref:Hydrolase n=1 Tax=Streptomyces cavernicola TaxID=3043613 RepID=A0ABT6SJ25_9ACTN|nr:acyl-CoA dehydrogenase family protein [Streptomyces sp. B-S-A6]MDI3408198.1 hydrolase [Streptomyces sp. B-S-A6]
MPDQPTSAADLSASVQRLASVAAQYAAESDAQRALPDPVVEALLDAGFAGHFVPGCWGGADGTVLELLHSVAAVAEGCTSAAWSASVLAGTGRLGAYLPEQGQRELWAKGADTPLAGALIPRGSATEVSDGWRVTGQWDFTSAVNFSAWALVCALLPQEGGGAQPWFFALPRADYQVADTWTSTGMRGTGSNTLVVNNVFVPRHRGFARDAMVAGRSVGSDARCHTAPLRLLSGVLFGAPALGAARAALRLRSAEQPPDTTDARGASARIGLARAAGTIDAAGLLLERAARVADAPSASALAQARNPADCAHAVAQLVDSVEGLVRVAGSSAFLEAHPLQRVWRDIHSMASHVALRFDQAGDAYGARLVEAAVGTV